MLSAVVFSLISEFAQVVSIVVAVVHPVWFHHTKSVATWVCSDSLFLTRVSGAAFNTLAALPTPTLLPHSPIGKIGIVWKKFCPKSCIFCPAHFPISFALIAAKTIIHMSPMAKKFTINRENQSIASHHGSLVNSISATLLKLMASLPVCMAVIFCVPNVWFISTELDDVKPLTSAVMKISEILSAATVTTGAKIIHMTPLISRYLSSFSILIKSLKQAFRTMNGDATI